MLGHEHLFNWWVQGCEKYLFHMLSRLEAGKVMVSLGSAVIGPISVFSRLREVELFFPKLSMYLCRERIGNFKTCGSWAYVILKRLPRMSFDIVWWMLWVLVSDSCCNCICLNFLLKNN